jgi:hypothetical protein
MLMGSPPWRFSKSSRSRMRATVIWDASFRIDEGHLLEPVAVQWTSVRSLSTTLKNCSM